MSELTKEINAFFRLAGKGDVDDLLSDIILTERQLVIFDMRYIKGKEINFIADTVGLSPYSVDKELKRIRDKIAKSLNL